MLLMEGTNIRPDGEEVREQPSETDIEAACAEMFRSTTGLALVTWSARNIDRLVTIYRAALRSGRTFVIDLYTASIAAATGNPNIPCPGDEWPHVRVYVPRWQRVKVKDAGQFHRVEEVKPYRLYERQLADNRPSYVSQFGLSVAQLFEREGLLADAKAIWSLWPGYLARTLVNVSAPSTKSSYSVVDSAQLWPCLHRRARGLAEGAGAGSHRPHPLLWKSSLRGLLLGRHSRRGRRMVGGVERVDDDLRSRPYRRPIPRNVRAPP